MHLRYTMRNSEQKLFIVSTMKPSTTVTFLPGKRGALNAVVGCYRYSVHEGPTLQGERLLLVCVEETKCSAWITLTGRVLTSNPTLWTFLPALREEDNLIDLL